MSRFPLPSCGMRWRMGEDASHVNIEPRHNFGKRECPSCACEVEANQNRCPICGYLFPHPTPGQQGLRRGGALVMLAILLALLLGGLFR